MRQTLIWKTGELVHTMSQGKRDSMLISGMTMTPSDPLGTTGDSQGIRVKFVTSDVVDHLV